MLDQLKALDTKVFLYFNNLGTEFWDPFWIKVSEVGIWVPFYALLIVLLFYVLKPKSAAWALLIIALNVVATDQGSVRLFKQQFERPRPCHEPELQDQMRLVKSSCGGKYGFVSSHASNTFGLAMLLGLILKKRLKWMPALLFFWAAMVAYSRVYLGVHYPADILGGALLGILIGGILARIFFNAFDPQYRSES